MTTEVEPPVKRIDHVGIVVADIDASLPFYVGTLGLRLVADAPRPDGTVRLAYLEAGDTTVQLVQPLLAGPAADYLTANGEGLHHICFEVGDLQATIDQIAGAERSVIEDGGRGCKVAFMSDLSEPVLFELSQNPS